MRRSILTAAAVAASLGAAGAARAQQDVHLQRLLAGRHGLQQPMAGSFALQQPMAGSHALQQPVRRR